MKKKTNQIVEEKKIMFCSCNSIDLSKQESSFVCACVSEFFSFFCLIFVLFLLFLITGEDKTNKFSFFFFLSFDSMIDVYKNNQISLVFIFIYYNNQL